MKKSLNNHLRFSVYSALLTAVIVICTAFLQFPIGNGGYIHLGDAMVFFAVGVLGAWGIVASALGSFLADIISGYAVFAFPSLLTKGCMALLCFLLFSTKPSKFSVQNLLVMILAELLMVIGYFLSTTILFGEPAAWSALVFNLVQALCGVVLGIFLLPIAFQWRRKIQKGNNRINDD